MTATVAPSPANGSDLRSAVTVTLTGSASAPATPTPVSVTLRATPIDATAGTAAAVEMAFPILVQPPHVSLERIGPALPDLYRGDDVSTTIQLT